MVSYCKKILKKENNNLTQKHTDLTMIQETKSIHS